MKLCKFGKNKAHDMTCKISIIVPTLNEEKTLPNLLLSLKNQTTQNYEVIIIDGGSTDETANIARAYDSRIVVEKGLPEYPSRNLGAKIANGEILLFTCADVVFPVELLAKVDWSFKDEQLIALTGPDYPSESSLAKIEYGAYNLARFVFSCFPQASKRFSTSTNFLAVRKDAFEKTGGICCNDLNGDGKLGKQLSEMGKVKFSNNIVVIISPRRFYKMGFLKFNLHYLYVLENFFPFLSKSTFLKTVKNNSTSVHQNMHLTTPKPITVKK
jgi:glycosyltransferase involved in cell wall biosynthesis